MSIRNECPTLVRLWLVCRGALLRVVDVDWSPRQTDGEYFAGNLCKGLANVKDRVFVTLTLCEILHKIDAC